ncbi:MAG: HEAT repeat domain-containing protein [Oscillatoriales cyanobacterium]|nr:MAG: HEAT repeat domain-containing protein [Oscillatoriales cyanobacterium]
MIGNQETNQATQPTASPALAQLIRAVDEADSSAKLVGAVRSLAAAQDPAAIPALMSALGYNNPGAAVAAVEGLVALGDVAVEPMLAQVDGYNYTARSWALRALAQIADPRALELLVAAAETDFAPSVRRAAAQGLGALRWERMEPSQVPTARDRVLAVLTVNATDLEWVVRYAAIAGLDGLLRSQPLLRQRILGVLQERSQQDSDLVVRLRAQWAIERLASVTT